MPQQVYNFGAGPAMLPIPVMEKIRDEFLDFQGMGIASYLLAVLEKIAKENQYTHFSASVLRENKAMLQVFKKRYPNLKLSTEAAGEVLIEMHLSDARETQKTSDQTP